MHDIASTPRDDFQFSEHEGEPGLKQSCQYHQHNMTKDILPKRAIRLKADKFILLGSKELIAKMLFLPFFISESTSASFCCIRLQTCPSCPFFDLIHLHGTQIYLITFLDFLHPFCIRKCNTIQLHNFPFCTINTPHLSEPNCIPISSLKRCTVYTNRAISSSFLANNLTSTVYNRCFILNSLSPHS